METYSCPFSSEYKLFSFKSKQSFRLLSMRLLHFFFALRNIIAIVTHCNEKVADPW